MSKFSSIDKAILHLENQMVQEGVAVHPKFWQATDVSARPEAQMRELCFVSFSAPIPEFEFDLEKLIKPNLPWAEDHFLERVGGKPVNPGTTWTSWPWSNSADKHRKNEKFSHNYMERYWPKFARNPEQYQMGIRFPYGDLDDVIRQIAKDPLTRQAYLPVFFPEDTGAVHGERVPCSIGYHFLIRDNKIHITYHLRSCDLWRHFRDDMYLTMRLGQWIRDGLFLDHGLTLEMGDIHVHIGSLHLFINDFYALTTRLSKER